MRKLLLKEIYGSFLNEKKYLDVEKFKKLSGDEAEEYLNNHGKEFGEGSARKTYLIDSSKILKLAKGTKGIAQNEAEVSVYTNPNVRSVVAKIFDYHPDFRWVISELVRPMEASRAGARDFSRLTGLDFNEFISDLDRLSAYSSEEIDGLEHFSDFHKAVLQMMNHESVLLADMRELEHWGKTSDGRVVLLDYGYTKETAKLYW